MQTPDTDSRNGGAGFLRLSPLLMLSACLGILAFKFFAATRINVNWDEFWFLSFVHTLLRDELTMVLQGAYTHLFTWLPAAGANEVDQVVAARVVMVGLLGLTAFLVWRIAARWYNGLAAAIPPFVYVSTVPVLSHGGSFRADSMLAPLLMWAAVLLTARDRSRRDEVLAGIALGLAAAITVKVLLFAPLILALLAAASGPGPARFRTMSDVARSALATGLTAAVCGALLVGLHAASISGATNPLAGALPAESVTSFAQRAASTTILDAGLFPRGNVLFIYAKWQPLAWCLIGAGFVISAFRRRIDLLAMSLALLPIAFYRNAYPYFYVVMMAPASLLAGIAYETMASYVARNAPRHLSTAFAALVCAGLLYQGVKPMLRFARDEQSIQREVLAAAHQIFPQPVNYIDRCGMVSSFRKVNPFMSTWAMAEYNAAGVPVMESAGRSGKAAFVLANVAALKTASPTPGGLLEVDREFVQRNYSPYWGPIRVAGGSATIRAGEAVEVAVPFAAEYRLRASAEVLVDGIRRRDGEVLFLSRPAIVTAAPNSVAQEPTKMKFVLASAAPPPSREPPPQNLFSGL